MFGRVTRWTIGALIAAALPAWTQVPQAPTNVRVLTNAGTLVQAKQWTTSDDGHYVTAENAVLRLRFAYNAQNYQGWFVGTGTGGGGRDGGIVELYYKPTSTTRNLIFRNGTWGSGYDNLDLWEAENQGGTQANFDAPDYSSTISAVMNSHSVTESAGRLVATFDFQFQAWHIVRTYTVYPWGDITVTSRLTVTQTADWCYLAHRFSLGVSPTSFTNGTTTYNWGGKYRAEAEHYHAWTDGAPAGAIGEDFYHYDKAINSTMVENAYAPALGRRDQFSGFLLDDVNGDDPDVVVFPGEENIYQSPYQQIAGKIGGGPYIETALFNFSWAPQGETTAQMTYFYMTSSSDWTRRVTWPTSLGTWTETFHVMLRRNLQPADYLPLWKTRARELAREAPTQVSGASATLNGSDKLYHLNATPGTSSVTFQWTRAATATNPIDYGTAFVVEQFDPTSVQAQGATVNAYYDASTHTTLLVVSGTQAAVPQPITISLSK